MRKRYLLLLLTIAASLATSGCRQQEPDPVSLLRQTQKAVRAIDTVAYKFRYLGIGEEASNTDTMTGTALIHRTDLSGSGYLLRLEAEVTPPDSPPFRVLGLRQRDGMIYRYEPDASLAKYGSIYGVGTVLTGWMRPALMYSFFDPEALTGDIEAETVAWEGRDLVDGESCDRVRVEFADDPERAEWCLGVADSLPRRLAFIEGESGSRLEIFDIRTGVAAADDRFEFDPPPDVEIVPVEYGLRPGSQLPSWSFETLGGENVTLAELSGEVLVLDFWATWCVPCSQSMVAIERLAQELTDQPVRFFAVNTMETAELAEVQRFMTERQLTSELLLEGDAAHLEATRGNLPAAVVIDRQGRFAGMTLGYYGSGSDIYLEHLIRTALDPDKDP